MFECHYPGRREPCVEPRQGGQDRGRKPDNLAFPLRDHVHGHDRRARNRTRRVGRRNVEESPRQNLSRRAERARLPTVYRGDVCHCSSMGPAEMKPETGSLPTTDTSMVARTLPLRIAVEHEMVAGPALAGTT